MRYGYIFFAILMSLFLFNTSFIFGQIEKDTLNNQQSFVGNTQPVYPIVLIHGINSNDLSWREAGGIVEYFTDAYGWDSETIDICLDDSINANDPSDNKEDDVDLKTQVSKKDFYLINYDVKYNGSLYKNNYLKLSFLVLSSDDTIRAELPEIPWDGRLLVGDIILIDDEYMQVNSINIDDGLEEIFIGVTRGLYGTDIVTHHYYGVKGLLIVSNESNQSSIMKQAYGLKLAIDEIKSVHGVNKVILVGHSMGGLAARCYNQFFSNEDVAKLVTIGTPNLGAIKDDIFYDELAIMVVKIDRKSEAVRDLAYWYDSENSVNPEVPGRRAGSDNGVFLFGGHESSIPYGEFINRDVDANGFEADIIIGLNQSAPPMRTGYYFITGAVLTETDNINILADNDGVVLTDRQWLDITYLYGTEYDWERTESALFAWHSEANLIYNERPWINGPDIWETHAKNEIISSLDEPDQNKGAYWLKTNNRLVGTITLQGNGSNLDVDYFKTYVTNSGNMDVTVTYRNLLIINVIEELSIYDENNQFISGASIFSTPFTLSVPVIPGMYYLKINGTATDDSWREPYTIEVNLNSNNEISKDLSKNILNQGDDISFKPTLKQNYPNPFNPTTTIEYSIEKTSFVSLDLYNVMGEKVRELVAGIQDGGNHNVNFTSDGLASGIYIYRLRAGDFTATERMIILK